jgi:Mn2+/Fe2+ NRAMP family transporter
MTTHDPHTDAADDIRSGLRMAHPPDPAELDRERAHLAALEDRPPLARFGAYLRLIGPGYLQSAMTLGGGTAVSSLLAGALFGYTLLWVAPVAMILGIVMLAAISYQTLSTGARPFAAMRTYAGGFFAWGWAIGALLASVIWHFPQYSLAAAVLVEMGEVVGIEGLRPQWMGFIVLAWALLISSMYERALKYMVWGIVLCFGWVVLRTGISDWGALIKGLLVPSVPGERNGVAGATIVLGGLAAAVGINMVFLYPYTLLARGWSREHRRLARFDLMLGMFIPYVLATSLIVIAAANTIHLDPEFSASRITPVEAAKSLAAVVGPKTGMIVFSLGILGMALSSITLHMLCAGFVASEVFGWEFGSRKYRLATLVPTVGVFGPVLWSEYAVWLAVPTSILCGFFLPVAYVGFILLQRSRRYLGDDRPAGARGTAWLGAMVFTTLFLTVFLTWTAATKGPGYFRNVFGSSEEPPPAEVRPEDRS